MSLKTHIPKRNQLNYLKTIPPLFKRYKETYNNLQLKLLTKNKRLLKGKTSCGPYNACIFVKPAPTYLHTCPLWLLLDYYFNYLKKQFKANKQQQTHNCIKNFQLYPGLAIF